jgi:hypothetical protein
VSVAKPARPARKGRLVLKVHREKREHRGQRGQPVNAAKLDRKAPQVRPVRRDHPAPKAIRVRRPRSASSPAPTTCTAQTTRSWFHLCARAARLMVQSAPRLARQRPYCARGNEARVGASPSPSQNNFASRISVAPGHARRSANQPAILFQPARASGAALTRNATHSRAHHRCAAGAISVAAKGLGSLHERQGGKQRSSPVGV